MVMAPMKATDKMAKKKTVSKMMLQSFKALSKRKTMDAAGAPAAHKMSKKKIALSKRKAKDAADEPVPEQDADEEAPKSVKQQERPAAKDKAAAAAEEEEMISAARKKELKGMPVADLKAILESKELKTGKKEDMIVMLLKVEAKSRAELRAHEAKVQAVVDKIKKDLNAKSNTELKELCATKGLKTGGGKDDKVLRLFDHAKEQGDVETIMDECARDARRATLASLEKEALLKLCVKAKLDPLVQEVMVERLFSREVATGVIRLPKPEDMKGPPQDKELLTKKRKELKAMNPDKLKKLAAGSGLEQCKKDDMIEALLSQAVATEADAALRKELKALDKEELKELITNQGLEAGTKEVMVEALLKKESKLREKLRLLTVTQKQLETKMKEELSPKTLPELKDLCEAKGLKMGGGKDEKVERLLQAAREGGEVDQMLLALARTARRDELGAMDKVALKTLCDKMGLDTLIKDVMVERIISSEFDVALEPAAKKARMK